MPTPTSQRRAFTLIELMIVVAIIAILAAILIPNFLHARAQSATAGCEGNEKMIATGLEEYAVDHGTYGASGVANTALLGTLYLGITPLDPVNASPYNVTVAAAGGSSYGSYLISDAGGHDTTTTRGLPGNPGGVSVVYFQNAGVEAK